MPRLTADLPEKFTMRASVEQRINFVTLGWYLGNGGKFGPAIRWFMDKYWPRFYASLDDDDRALFEEFKKRVIEKDQFESPLLPPSLDDLESL
jgi:hypothetical protein